MFQFEITRCCTLLSMLYNNVATIYIYIYVLHVGFPWHFHSALPGSCKLRILSAAVQLRSLQDATQGFTPLFVKDWLHAQAGFVLSFRERQPGPKLYEHLLLPNLVQSQRPWFP